MDTVNVEVTKEKLLQDLNLVVKETEQLLRDTAAVGGEKVAAWRVGVEENLKSAKATDRSDRARGDREGQGDRAGDRRLRPRQALAGDRHHRRRRGPRRDSRSA